MSRSVAFLLVLLVFVVQFSVLGIFIDPGRIPNIFVVFMAGFVIFYGFEKSLGTAVLAGLLMDVAGNLVVGSGTLALLLVIWILNRIKLVAELRSKRYFFALLFSLLVAGASILFDFFLKLTTQAANYIFNSGVSPYIYKFDADYAWRLLYAIILSWPVYLFIRKINRLSRGNATASK